MSKDRIKLDSQEAFQDAMNRILDYENESEIKCVTCGFPLDEWGNDFEDFHPDKGYNYCHSYCCACCPETNEEFCDKERFEGEDINSTIEWSKRKEYV